MGVFSVLVFAVGVVIVLSLFLFVSMRRNNTYTYIYSQYENVLFISEYEDVLNKEVFCRILIKHIFELLLCLTSCINHIYWRYWVIRILMLSVVFLMAPNAANANPIKNLCEKKWKEDYEMAVSCINDQNKANDRVAEIENRDLAKPQIDILEKCKGEWFFDFEMVESCYTDEEKARIWVTSLISKGGFDEAQKKIIIRCVNEWPNEYEMIKSCYTEQNEAYQSLK